MNRFTLGYASLLWLLFAAPAHALPETLAYEGQLVNGVMPVQGPVDLRVNFFNVPAAGAAVWTELHPGVDLFEGYFRIDLGSVEALDPAVFDNDIYVAVSIDGAAEHGPRHPVRSLAAAFIGVEARGAIGHIHPTEVRINNRLVIDLNGNWVGDPAGRRGVAGAQGGAGPVGPEGPQGPAGPGGQNGSADTPLEIRDKLRTVDGAGSGVDADTLAGVHAAGLPRTPAQVMALLKQADGAGSGIDADTLDGFHAGDFPSLPAQVKALVLQADGAGSGLDGDRLDGHSSEAFVRTPAHVRDRLADVDGVNSGFDVDSLDGLDSTRFLRIDVDDTVDGDLTVDAILRAGAIDGYRATPSAAPPVACIRANRGRWYFDTDGGYFAGCDGAVWQRLGQGVGGGPSFVPVLPDITYKTGIAEANYEPASWGNAGAHNITINKGSATTWLRVQHTATNGYYMTCHGSAASWRITVDGVAQRELRSHGSTRAGWRMKPTTMGWMIPPLPVGNHVIRLQVIKYGCANDVRTGWAGLGTFTVEEIAPDRLAVKRHMSDTRYTPNSWADLPERRLSYDKKTADSILEITYTDTLGYSMVGGNASACSWRLLMDGKPTTGRAHTYNGNSAGWRIDGRQIAWRLDHVTKGDHHFQIQVIRHDPARTSECLAGWPNAATANSLSVVERDRGNFALRRNMYDTRSTPNTFSDLPERSVVHTKNAAATAVRVTYQDTLGYHMTGHSWGCRWRLAVDGVAQTYYGSHTSSGTGWRINPHRLMWVVPGLTAGNHTYTIQADRPNAASASECLAGYSSPNNFLLVEEVR
jgi:hypothetical protein